MNFTDRTVKLEKLIEAKSDLEFTIRAKLIEKYNLFFSRDYEAAKIADIDETIATIDEQLVEVKLSIQQANTNEKHSDGNNNNFYIYKLSSLNRKLASLRELEDRGESNLLLVSKSLAKGKSYHHNSKLRERLTTKKEIEKRLKELAKEIVEVEKAISEIKPKLAEFNRTHEVKVKVLEGFEELKSLK